MVARADGPAPSPSPKPSGAAGSRRGVAAQSTPPQSSTVTSKPATTSTTSKPATTSTTSKPATTSTTSKPTATASGPVGNSSGMAYTPKPWEAVHVDTSSLTGVGNASNYSSPTWNQEESRKDAYLTWGDLSKDMQDQITALAKKNGGRSGKVLWETAVDQSEKSVRNGDPKTPWDFLKLTAQNGSDGNGSGSNHHGGGSGRRGGSSGSGSGSGGPGGVSQSIHTTNAPALDVRSIADSVAMEFLGRGLTQAEAQKVLARVRQYENSNPSVSTGQSGAGVSVGNSSGGVTDAGRQQVIERILAKNPEFGDYQKATTMMDWFNSALSERLQNG